MLGKDHVVPPQWHTLQPAMPNNTAGVGARRRGHSGAGHVPASIGSGEGQHMPPIQVFAVQDIASAP